MFNSNLRKKLLNNKKIIITEYWERWHAVSPNLNCSVKLSKKNCKYPGKILLMVLSFIQLYAYPLACLACLWPYTAPHSVFKIAIPSLLQCHFLVWIRCQFYTVINLLVRTGYPTGRCIISIILTTRLTAFWNP